MADDIAPEIVQAQAERATSDATGFLESFAGVEPPEPEQPPAAPAQERRTIAQRAGAVASDVGRGILEAPKQIVGGALDAAEAGLGGVAAFDEWASDALGLPKLQIFNPETGAFDLDLLSPEEGETARVMLPEVGEAQTVTGGLTRGISQFLTGFVGGARALGGLGAATRAGAIAKGSGAAAISDFAAFDGHEQRLSDLIQSNPTLANPITEYLASDMSDSELEGRLKNVAEGALSDMILGGLIGAVRQIRLARRAKDEIGAETYEQAAQRLVADPNVAEGLEPDLGILGRPSELPAATDEIETYLEQLDAGARQEPPAAAPDLTPEPAAPKPTLEDIPESFTSRDEALANLREIVDRGADREVIEQHPAFVEAVSEFTSRAERATNLDQAFDTPQWHSSREYVFGDEVVQGTENAVPRWVQQAEEFAGEAGPAYERKATIVLGPPAAGKSTIAEELARVKRAAILDSDEIKKTLPEYEGGIGAAAVHEESSTLADLLEDALRASGTNVVFPKVGGSPGSIRRAIERFKADGYEVELVNMAVSSQEAYRRMVGRFVNTGRVIPPSYVDAVGDNPTATYRTLKDEGVADGYAQIDNNGPRDAPKPVTDLAGRNPLEGSPFDLPAGGRAGDVPRERGAAGDRAAVSGEGAEQAARRSVELDPEYRAFARESVIPEPVFANVRSGLEPTRAGLDLTRSPRMADPGARTVPYMIDARNPVNLEERGIDITGLTGDEAYELMRPLRDEGFDVALAPDGRIIPLKEGILKPIREPGFAQTRAEAMDRAAAEVKGTRLVNSEGEPLVLLHGTDRDYLELDIGKVGKADPGFVGDAVYLSPMRYYADQYGVEAAKASGRPPRTIETFADLRNPIEIQGVADKSELPFAMKDAIARHFESTGLAPREAAQKAEETFTKLSGGKTAMDVVNEMFDPNRVDVFGEPTGLNRSEAMDLAMKRFGQQARQWGYDGVIGRQGGQILEVAVFDPSRIKVIDDRLSPTVRASLEAKRRLAQQQGVTTIPMGGGDVYVNWNRINGPEDLKAVIQRTADAARKEIEAGARFSRSNAETELSAEQLDAWKILEERRVGDPLNAEQSLAVRRLWASSGQRVIEAARAVREAPTPANQFAFRRTLALHGSIQREVIAARTETARALQQWAIPAGTDREMMIHIEETTRMFGGEVTDDLAGRILQAHREGNLAAVDQMARRSPAAATFDAVAEYWTNSILSGPKTHLVNIGSNTGVIGLLQAERLAAAAIGAVRGGGDRIAFQEAAVAMHATIATVPEALRLAGKAFRTGQSGFGMGKVELPYKRALSSEQLGQTSSARFNAIMNQPVIARGIDVIGTVATIPGRALGAADEFFKTVNFRSEIHALALRQARQEAASGGIPEAGIKERIAELIQDPSEQMRIIAREQAQYATFTNDAGRYARALTDLRYKAPILRFVIPFVNTPANILRFATERTPMAPLLGDVRADIRAGGIRRDMALARMGLGSLAMAWAFDQAMNGRITGAGPSNYTEVQTLRRMGWQRYSIKIGDRFFAYNRLDPLGMQLGVAAELAEIALNSEEDPGSEWDETIYRTIGAVGQNMMDRTYLTGIADLSMALSDPTRFAPTYIERLLGSFVPTIGREIASFIEPEMKHATNTIARMKERIPGLRGDLPTRHDLWGRPISYQSGLGNGYDAVSPIYSSKLDPEPIDEEFVRLDYFPGAPSNTITIDGERFTLRNLPEVYQRYMVLQGGTPASQLPVSRTTSGDLTASSERLQAHGDRTLLETLNDIVTGRHELSAEYADASAEGKEDIIQRTMRDYRAAARDQLIAEHPDVFRPGTGER